MADWTDFGSQKDAKFRFDYVAGMAVNPFTMVVSGSYLMMSKIATTQDAALVDGEAPSDWVILASTTGDALTQPYINFIRTQDTINTLSVTGTGDDNVWPSEDPQPLTGGNYEGYRKIGYLVDNKSQKMTLQSGNDETGAALSLCDVVNDEDGSFRVDGFTTFKHTQNNATVGFVFAAEVGGNYIFSPRPVRQRVPNGAAPANMAGEGILSVPAGSKLSLWAASDVTGVLTLDTLSILITRFAEL